MFKTIVVPTDFSVCAQNAANYAVSLALQNNSNVILVHSTSVRFSEAGALMDYSQQIKQVSQEYIKEEQERIIRLFPKIEGRISWRISIVDLDIEIKELEADLEADLVVMGTKGRSGWEEILLGSETARIIESARIPVLAIPANYGYSKAREVVFACSLEEQLSSTDKQLLSLFIHEKAKIHLYHNYKDYLDMDIEKEQQLLKEFHRYFKQYIDFQLEFNTNNVESIEEFSKSVHADFLVVRKQHKSFLKDLFSTSVSKGLSYRAKMPLLVLK